MKKHKGQMRVVCVSDEGNPASLQVGRSYRVLQDPSAQKLNLLRVVDESGSDYLYPVDQFAPEPREA